MVFLLSMSMVSSPQITFTEDTVTLTVTLMETLTVHTVTLTETLTVHTVCTVALMDIRPTATTATCQMRRRMLRKQLIQLLILLMTKASQSILMDLSSLLAVMQAQMLPLSCNKLFSQVLLPP